VPILDMLISVIFFLLLTTSFMQLTKESVPPSSVSTITDPVTPPPVAAKLICVETLGKTRLILTWSGATPGRTEREVELETDNFEQERTALLNAASEIINDFSLKYPNEKTLQVGLGREVTYQKLIAIMDGVKEKTPDLVLFDYKEAQERAGNVL
jgi:hypothetical protein